MNNWAKTLLDTIFSSSFIVGGLTFLVALVLMLACGGPMIAWLRNKRWRKQGESWTVREDTPDTHQAKQGTPSMGGIGIIGACVLAFTGVIITGIGLAQISNVSSNLPKTSPIFIVLSIVLPLMILPITFVTHGLLGLADDWSKASGRGGLRARTKLLFQFTLAISFLAACLALPRWGQTPFVPPPWHGGDVLWPAMMMLLIIFVVGTCNAVNLTDGLDGLAAGLAVITCLGLVLARFDSVRGPGYEGVAILFCFALMGACLGFLKFNKYKAQVFMGDTGSLAIGAGLAAAAILLHAVWLLPFVGFMFYIEAASVTIQVLWFKWTKRKTGEGQRLFRRAPLHHHFELAGWSEWRVVLTFWAVNLFTTAIGLVLWHLKILPRFP